MESRWARLRTYPLLTTDNVALVPAGNDPDGACPVGLRLYTFTRPSLQQYTILLLEGTHTHPRGIRAIRKGELRSRVFHLLAQDPLSTRAEVARRIRDSMQLEPSSAAIRHAYADYRLTNNPLREDQVGVMARAAAAAGGPSYIRKTLFCGRGGEHHDTPYSYVIFHLDTIIDVAALHRSFCADLSFKDFDAHTRPEREQGEWHMFSITAWSHRLHKTVSVFKAAVIGECEDVYEQLLSEFFRECALRGQQMPTVGTAVTGRTSATLRERELVSLTLDFCTAQAQGAAMALAKRAGMASATDAARAFLRECAVHYRRCISKLPLDREGADKDLWAQLEDAPRTMRTEENVATLLADLNRHEKVEVRAWAAWASKPVVRHMAFPHVYSRLDAELLLTVPATTNMQKSTHHSNLCRSPPGSLLKVITRHQALDALTMRDFFSAGSGGSHHSRPLNEERRYTQAEMRARQHRKRPRDNDPQHQDADREETNEEATPRGRDHAAAADHQTHPYQNANNDLPDGAGSRGPADEEQLADEQAARRKGGVRAGGEAGCGRRASPRTCASSTPGPATMPVFPLPNNPVPSTTPLPLAALAVPAAPMANPLAMGGLLGGGETLLRLVALLEQSTRMAATHGAMLETLLRDRERREGASTAGGEPPNAASVMPPPNTRATDKPDGDPPPASGV